MEHRQAVARMEHRQAVARMEHRQAVARLEMDTRTATVKEFRIEYLCYLLKTGLLFKAVMGAGRHWSCTSSFPSSLAQIAHLRTAEVTDLGGKASRFSTTVRHSTGWPSESVAGPTAGTRGPPEEG